MKSVTLDLFRARDAAESFAVSRAGDSGTWRAQYGTAGQAFEKVWSVEAQCDTEPPDESVDWDAVLRRVIEAYQMSDPVIADFEWPRLPDAVKGR